MIEVNHLLMQVFQVGISTRNLARVALSSGLFGVPKSGTSVSAADVNARRELEDAWHYQPST